MQNKGIFTSGFGLLDPTVYDTVMGVDAHLIAVVNNK